MILFINDLFFIKRNRNRERILKIDKFSIFNYALKWSFAEG